ncbi:MAG: helix-turn-helix domain-containing protein [Candidatus Bathyarchaeota archaeon]|nr:helix-turn-helix domain-containing protein [Candidatus Bathyarchaeota archaeon]
MYLDAFDRRIVDVLRARGGSMTLAELVRNTGFARSTVVIHLERLGTEGLLLKEKKLSKGRGRPRFMYRLAGTPTPKAASPPSIVALEFSKLRKACRYEKGGYCKLAKNTCAAQNCQLTIKPK